MAAEAVCRCGPVLRSKVRWSVPDPPDRQRPRPPWGQVRRAGDEITHDLAELGGSVSRNLETDDAAIPTVGRYTPDGNCCSCGSTAAPTSFGKACGFTPAPTVRLSYLIPKSLFFNSPRRA